MMADRALVLGGGGVVGIAWEIRVLKGLQDGGVDPAAADLIIGTSAGAIVGSKVAAGLSLDALLAVQLGPSDGRMESLVAEADPQALQTLFAKIMALTEMDEAARIEIGSLALAAKTPSEERRLEMVVARLGVDRWPEKRLLITAVDAETGASVAWERASGISLGQAVASSGAVPGMFPPPTINGRRYIDGGFRSVTNADLARGAAAVLIVAPVAGGETGLGALAGKQIAAEVAELRGGGAAVEVISPDAAALTAFGPNLMDPAFRNAAAEAGVRQGTALAAGVRTLWAGAAV